EGEGEAEAKGQDKAAMTKHGAKDRDPAVKARAEALFEVDPVSWTPEHLCSRSPRWRRRDHLTLLSSVARWSSWCVPAARQRNWHGSSNRRRSRSRTGSVRLSATPAAAMWA